MIDIDVVAAADGLVPAFRERAAAADRDRGISRENYEAMRDARLFDVLKPKRYGGLELTAHEHAMITLALSRACGSTGWVYGILSGDNQFVLADPETTQDEVWGADKDATLAGSIFLSDGNSASRVPGGYRLTGSWGFCSGSDFADLLVFAARVEGADGCAFLVPKADVAVVDDWFPTGLRGTGSRRCETADVFVPEHRVIPLADLLTIRPERIALHPGFSPLAAPTAYGKFSQSAVAVGAAYSAVEWFVAQGTSTSRVASALGGSLRLADQDYVATEFTEASGELEAAMLVVEQRSREIGEQTRRRETPTEREVATNVRDYALITRIAVRSVNRIQALVGTKAGFAEHPVSRAKRDVEMAAGHVTLNWRQAAVRYASSFLVES